MEPIKEGMRVKYIGETNDYTFEDDLSQNSIGIVKNVFQADKRQLFKWSLKMEF